MDLGRTGSVSNQVGKNLLEKREQSRECDWKKILKLEMRKQNCNFRLKLLWLTLTQANSKCEIEFLPVYRPSDDEKKDPKLYASNVRTLMAKYVGAVDLVMLEIFGLRVNISFSRRALGVPTSDYSYEDCRLVKKAKELQLSQSSQLIRTQKLRSRLGLVSPHMVLNTDSTRFKICTCVDKQRHEA